LFYSISLAQPLLVRGGRDGAIGSSLLHQRLCKETDAKFLLRKKPADAISCSERGAFSQINEKDVQTASVVRICTRTSCTKTTVLHYKGKEISLTAELRISASDRKFC